jgi:hypothetical protein
VESGKWKVESEEWKVKSENLFRLSAFTLLMLILRIEFGKSFQKNALKYYKWIAKAMKAALTTVFQSGCF